MLPYALHCGMTSDEFWHGEPRMLCCYIKKHELELDEINYQSWLIGLYVYKAIGSIVGNMFPSDNGIQDSYFEKPLNEFYSNFEQINKKENKTKETNYRKQVNYWAKFAKKGVSKYE